VRQLTEGIVRVTGTAQTFDGLLSAPCSGRPCLAYDLTVQRMTGKSWVDLLFVRAARSFLVAEETGTVVIHPDRHYWLVLVEDRTDEAAWCTAPDDATFGKLAAIFKAEGIPLTGGPFDQALRYHEGIVEVGERVTVQGRAVREVSAGGERADPRSPPEIVVLRGTAENPLRISDQPAVTG
jgi:hypothetical protein